MDIDAIRQYLKIKTIDLYKLLFDQHTLSEFERGELYAYENILRHIKSKDKAEWKSQPKSCKAMPLF